MRLEFRVDINDVPVDSLNNNILGHAIQTTSTDKARPKDTPQPSETISIENSRITWKKDLHCTALVTGSVLRQCSQKMSSPPGFRSLYTCRICSSRSGSEHCVSYQRQYPYHEHSTLLHLGMGRKTFNSP